MHACRYVARGCPIRSIGERRQCEYSCSHSRQESFYLTHLLEFVWGHSWAPKICLAFYDPPVLSCPGVMQKPTILALNAALLGCILSLLALLVLCISGAPALVPHIGFLLFLAVGLLFLINW